MTISEIAKLAGVSSAAVSRYLNDGSLSQEKRQRIEKVIRETNYRPSEYARTMRTKKSNRIGVLVPQIDSEAVPKILSGISERMAQKNYHVLLMNSNLSLEKEIGILETFEQSQVDGLIFVNGDEPLMSGDFCRVRVTGALEYDLIGELCDESAE